MYFVHSYYVDTDASFVTASADYHLAVPAIVGSGNVFGMQFHPEKSGEMGMSLLKNYLVISRKEGSKHERIQDLSGN